MKPMRKVSEIFDAFESERRCFDRVSVKLSTRPDLNAMLLLERLFPNKPGNLIDGAEHGAVFLAVTLDDLYSVCATITQIRTLVHCGVWYQGGRLYLDV